MFSRFIIQNLKTRFAFIYFLGIAIVQLNLDSSLASCEPVSAIISMIVIKKLHVVLITDKEYLLVCRNVFYLLGWKKLIYRVISSCTKFYCFYFTIESYSSLMAILLTILLL